MIALSDDFYDEVVRHPVPNDLEVVKTLAASPAILDLYMWFSYRASRPKERSRSPSSANSVWQANSAALNTTVRADFGPCWINRW